MKQVDVIAVGLRARSEEWKWSISDMGVARSRSEKRGSMSDGMAAAASLRCGKDESVGYAREGGEKKLRHDVGEHWR